MDILDLHNFIGLSHLPSVHRPDEFNFDRVQQSRLAERRGYRTDFCSVHVLWNRHVATDLFVRDGKQGFGEWFLQHFHDRIWIK